MVVFSPNGQLLASRSDDNTIRLWDPVTGECRARLEGHTHRVGAVVFSPDGQLLASRSDDNIVRLWNPVTGDSRGTLECHLSWVEVVLPDRFMVSARSDDNTSMIFRDAKKSILHQWKHSFSRDGPQLILNGNLVDIPSDSVPLTVSPKNQISKDPFYSLRVEDQWVTWKNRRILWLPHNCRPGVFAVKGNKLVIGNKSGRLTFLSFSTTTLQF